MKSPVRRTAKGLTPIEIPRRPDAVAANPRIITSVIMAEGAKEKITVICLRAGKGMRARSAWINEAVEDFLAFPNWIETIMPFTHALSPGVHESISLTPENYFALWDAAIQIGRRMYEDSGKAAVEGIDISRVVRFAIAHRLTREEYSMS